MGHVSTPGLGGGYSDIFTKRRLWPFFWGFKILNLNIFRGFRKMNVFGGMKILWIFFGGLVLGVISVHFRVFHEVNVQNGDIFGVVKISNIFGVCLIFQIFVC